MGDPAPAPPQPVPEEAAGDESGGAPQEAGQSSSQEVRAARQAYFADTGIFARRPPVKRSDAVWQARS